MNGRLRDKLNSRFWGMYCVFVWGDVICCDNVNQIIIIFIDIVQISVVSSQTYCVC